MNSASTTPVATTTSATANYTHAFGGLLLRDLRVLRREVGPFLVRIIMNPLLFLFVFTYVFPHIGQGGAVGAGMGGASHGITFGTVLLPGLMAVAIMFSGISSVALPLASEFGYTREIEDRVMCPLPVAVIALEKVFFSAMQSILAAAVVFPLAYYMPAEPVHVHVASWPLLFVVLVLAGIVSGALGLAIGTTAEPRQIGLVFAVVVVPITFLGCVYYPWAVLNHIPWLQYAVLVNPIVYISEGLRSSLTPGLPHMPVWAILVALVSFGAGLTAFGTRGFLKRVQG